MSELSKLADGFGDQLLQTVKSTLGEEWEHLPPEAVEEVQAVLRDAAELTMRSLAGENMTSERAVVEATIAGWEFVGYSRTQAALEAAAKEALAYAGKVLLGILAAAV